MSFDSLREFLLRLESDNDLDRIEAPVDPELEMTEIACRRLEGNKKALLFEKPVGARFPVAMNFLATRRRIERALGGHPAEVGERLARLAEWAKHPKASKLGPHASTLWRGLRAKPKPQDGGPVREQTPGVDVRDWPVLKCWPEDAGRFFTLPLVLTRDPETGGVNLGMYRMQVHSLAETGMHIQIQRGAGVHLHKAEKAGKPLPCVAALGGDPLLILAAIAPLPEGVDELTFAGFLRGRPVPVVHSAQGIPYPAIADFAMEGVIPCGVRKMEGPFGDHYGHYSLRSEHPVFQIRRIHHRKDAVYPATVVGKPPKEDTALGWAVGEMLVPLLKLMKPEISDLHAYPEAGFHTLAVAAVRQRYEKEAVKTALGLLGEGQFSLTKCLILVDPDCDVEKIEDVAERIAKHFDPERDFILIPGTPYDTLDFTSLTLNLGSKMILDATGGGRPPALSASSGQTKAEALDDRIRKSRWIGTSLLFLWTDADPRALLRDLLKQPPLGAEKILFCLSDDVDPQSVEQILWGTFTRFEPARDLFFESTELQGPRAVNRGRMGVDATYKKEYPKPIVMSEEIVRRVDRRWREYFP